MSLLIRRGLEIDRLTITPAEGEFIYTTDDKKVYMGDGVTVGGNLLTGGGGGLETDPIFTASDAFGIIGMDITNWNTAFSWGDHSGLYSLLGHTHTFASLTSKPTTLLGYGITDAYPLVGNPSGFITSYSETDPIYIASSWFGTTNNSSNWNTAFGWGNHASAGYLTSFTESDPIWLTDKPNYLTSALAASTYALIGHNHTGVYQPLDATLTALAGLATGANKIPYSTGTDVFGQLDLDTDGALAANSDTHTIAKAVKTYSDAKVEKRSAYTFRANNTASTANVTDVFKDIGATAITAGVPIWTGTTPSGAENHEFTWTQIGKMVTMVLFNICNTWCH